jgi:hypothetical protein
MMKRIVFVSRSLVTATRLQRPSLPYRQPNAGRSRCAGGDLGLPGRAASERRCDQRRMSVRTNMARPSGQRGRCELRPRAMVYQRVHAAADSPLFADAPRYQLLAGNAERVRLEGGRESDGVPLLRRAGSALMTIGTAWRPKRCRMTMRRPIPAVAVARHPLWGHTLSAPMSGARWPSVAALWHADHRACGTLPLAALIRACHYCCSRNQELLRGGPYIGGTGSPVPN